MQISGPEIGKLKNAILSAFKYPDFSLFLLERHNAQIDNIATPFYGFDYQVGNIVTFFNQKGWTPRLISTLIAERSELPIFQELAYSWGIHPTFYSPEQNNVEKKNGLERLVNNDPTLDVNVLIKGVTDYKRCVCRIKAVNDAGQASFGTGFLVGEDLILTNYHVLENIIKDSALAKKVVCKFDYELDAEGIQINSGIDIDLHQVTPVLAYSPTCLFDLEGTEDVNIDWPDTCFDYALAKLSEPIGGRPYGLNGENTTSPYASLRGWIKASETPPSLSRGSHIIILQHPDKEPLKIAIGLSKIIGCDDNERRVRYAVNTMEGSSGSPCFDHKFNWLGMHNMGDPNYSAKYNQGIPAARILEDLAKQNVHL